MVITMDIIKEYFGDIDLTDELLVKKTYKQLAKKYHPDITGDDKKFKELMLCFDTIKDIQPDLKAMNDKALKKEELENCLKNIERDINVFKTRNDELINELKDINSKISSLKKELKESFLYFLFDRKSKYKKIVNFFLLYFGIQVAILMLVSKFSIPVIFASVCFSSSNFIWIFRKKMTKLNVKKVLISKYLQKKDDLDYESSRLEKRISSFEIKKLAILKNLQEIEDNFKVS